VYVSYVYIRGFATADALVGPIKDADSVLLSKLSSIHLTCHIQPHAEYSSMICDAVYLKECRTCQRNITYIFRVEE
jgi:hypothetical protein